MIIAEIEQIERDDPQPSLRSADILALIEAHSTSPERWNEVFTRFSSTRSAAVAAALAWFVARDADSDEPKTALSDALGLMRQLRAEQQNVLHMILEAVDAHVRQSGAHVNLGGSETDLAEFILKCLSSAARASYNLDGWFIVTDSAVSLLFALNNVAVLGDVFLYERRTELGRRLDSLGRLCQSMQDEVDALLRAVDSL